MSSGCTRISSSDHLWLSPCMLRLIEPMKSQRLCLQCTKSGRIHELPETGIFLIGRQPSCDLRLEDKQVSRSHARIVRDAEGISIEDLGSTNGTKVNYTKINNKAVLRRGDIIVIGDYAYRLFSPDNQSEETQIHRRNAGLEDSYVVEEDPSNMTSFRQVLPLPPGWPGEETMELSVIKAVLNEPVVSRMLQEIERHQQAVPAALIVTAGKQKGRVILLKISEGPVWVLGRGSDCALCLHDSTLSEHHAELHLKNGAWFVRDANSRNGSLVNGHRIHEAEIKQHDVLEFGAVAVIFHLT
ncbi:MAG: hypothetical protein C1943_16735 [Halochromatium sp.]|nr:hypothetical protein [Halochromatium sp.]